MEHITRKYGYGYDNLPMKNTVNLSYGYLIRSKHLEEQAGKESYR